MVGSMRDQKTGKRPKRTPEKEKGKSQRPLRRAPRETAGRISVIVPMYNEAAVIGKLLASLEELRLSGAEILFADGGSTDGTLERIPDKAGYEVFTAARKGRAFQMNEAASRAKGEILFFVHADSELPRGAEQELRRVLRTHDAGCFGIDFRKKNNFFLYTCKWISNHRVKDRKVMFGDQGIFIRRALFYRAGRFPELPLMEDYQFSLTLREMGVKLGMTRKRIYTSPRRFAGSTREKLRVMWQMNRLRAAYREGVPIEEIAKAYRDIR